MKFTEIKLSQDMQETLKQIGYTDASPIQEKVIPSALQGNDILGQAQTGTGKTAAFGIPIIEKTIPGGGLQHLILAPSRELAAQIHVEMKKLAQRTSIKFAMIIGGISYDKQRTSLKKKPDIIVATPGRLMDQMDKGNIKVHDCITLTLDEADEMLNFGFLEDIKKISKTMKKDIQRFFLTATFNKKVKALAQEILTNPMEVKISSGMDTAANINQAYVVVKEKGKLNALAIALQMLNPQGAIIFGRTKRRVDELFDALSSLGFSVAAIQGDMRQRERSVAMDKFRKGQINILIGTDVMARGIDVDHVDYVFNFDLPMEIEYYTHRIGRTGRAGRVGTSISFVKESETPYFAQIMEKTGSKAEKWPIPSDADLQKAKEETLTNTLKELFDEGSARYGALGLKLAGQYSAEELGVMLATKIIGDQVKMFDIKLTPEPAVNAKGGGRGNRRSGGRRRGRGNNFSSSRDNGGGKKRYGSSSRDGGGRNNFSRNNKPRDRKPKK